MYFKGPYVIGGPHPSRRPPLARFRFSPRAPLCSVESALVLTSQKIGFFPFQEDASINNGGNLQVLILARHRIARRFPSDQSISRINFSYFRADSNQCLAITCAFTVTIPFPVPKCVRRLILRLLVQFRVRHEQRNSTNDTMVDEKTGVTNESD